MGQLSLDICECVLELGEDGEPTGFAAPPCPVHVAHSAEEVAREVRAKSATLIKAGLHETPHLAIWGYDKERTVHVVNVDMMSGDVVVVASSTPLSLEEFKAAIS